MRRRVAYVLPDVPWWVTLVESAVGAAICAVVLLIVLMFAGCGDNVECPPPGPAVPAPCVPASGAALNLCGYSTTVAGYSYPVAGCTGFVANDGCTVPVDLARPDAIGRTLVDALCVARCEATP